MSTLGTNLQQDRTPISAMEPMLPAEGVDGDLVDLAFDLATKAAGLAGTVSPTVLTSVGDLVRSMNCYYTNLIEGHDTHPRDIERALKDDFAAEPEKRDLQREAKAHIEVQGMIDRGEAPAPALSPPFIVWAHRKFCERLPEELLSVAHRRTGEPIPVVPGAFREIDVEVGRHVPPEPAALPVMLERFRAAYDPIRLSKPRRLIAIAAAHHRFVWIHPFLDGNGRVVRLQSHAALREADVGSALWSVSRGLARRVEDYKRLLQAADKPRQGDRDGRGHLSETALVDFCRFFLDVAIDQIDYMAEILDTKRLLMRMERHVDLAAAGGQLPEGSFPLLREALLVGEFHRGRAPAITGYRDRKARQLLARLILEGYLVSDTPKGPVRLAFPSHALEELFPRLYPAGKG